MYKKKEEAGIERDKTKSEERSKRGEMKEEALPLRMCVHLSRVLLLAPLTSHLLYTRNADTPHRDTHTPHLGTCIFLHAALYIINCRYRRRLLPSVHLLLTFVALIPHLRIHQRRSRRRPRVNIGLPRTSVRVEVTNQSPGTT